MSIGKNLRMFFLEITNRCNFDCDFCPCGVSCRSRGDMASGQAFRIIDELQELGFDKKIFFHVLGEPLLHPEVFKIVDYAADAKMKPVLFTNGGTLTDGVLKSIMASKAREVVISMQTINKRTYNMLRNTPFNWDNYLVRVQNALKVASRKNGVPFRVSIGIKKKDPLHPGDIYFFEYDSKDEIKEGIKEIFSMVKDPEMEKVFSELDSEGLSNMQSIKIASNISLSVKPIGNWRRVWLDEPLKEGTCVFFGKELAVLSNGDVTFCHIDYDGRTKVGNIREESLVDIIKKSHVEKMFCEFASGKQIATGCEYCKVIKNT